MSQKIYELKNITKIYRNEGQEFTALKDVSLDIYEGEIFGIIGMSGAGKSTLVRTLNRLEEIDAGNILFLGNDIGELKPVELRKVRQSISMIFQSLSSGGHAILQKSAAAGVPAEVRGRLPRM